MKVKDIFNKYLTQKVRNIISICIIIFGIIYIINYSFYKPTYINKYIASNIYKAPANSSFDDQNFYNCVVDAYNRENNTNLGYTTNLTDSQLKTIENLYCPGKKINSASGLSKMIGLKYLNLNQNELANLDVSRIVNLERFSVSGNKITSLDLSNNVKLTYLDIGYWLSSIGGDQYGNRLANLDLSKNIALKELYTRGNELTNLNLNNNVELEKLYIDYEYNLSGTLDLSNNTKIKKIEIIGTELEKIIFGNQSLLSGLLIINSKLTDIKLDKLSSLKQINLNSNNLTTLDVSKNALLENLNVCNNQLVSLNINGATSLTDLNAYNNQLASLDVSNNQSLTKLNVYNNQLSGLNINGANALTELYVSDNQLTNLDVSNNKSLIKLYVSNNKLSSLNINGANALTELYANDNQLTNLDVSNNSLLTRLYVYNNKIMNLNVEKNIKIEELDAKGNQLTNIDVGKNISLEKLIISNNQLTSLDVSKNISLKILAISDNQLASIDVGKNISLEKLKISNNQLTSLDVSKNISLKILAISDNQLASIDVGKNISLEELYIDNNYLTSLDISKNSNLQFIGLTDNNFSNTLTMYIGNVGEINSVIKLPSHLYLNTKWRSSRSNNTAIATIDNNANVTAVGIGTAEVVSENKIEGSNRWITYTTKTTVNVFELESNKYDINASDGYIYVGSDKDANTIKDNLIVPDYIVPVVDLSNNKLELKYNDSVVKEFDIVRINSNNYKIGSDYIYTRHYSDISGLSCYNCNASIEDNNVIIKYNNIEIDRFKLVKFNNKYTLYCISCSDGAGIYTGIDNDEEIINNLAVINGNTIIDNNILKITYNDKVLEEFDIRGFSTNYKILDNNVLYTGFNKFNINYISYRGNKVSGKYSDNKFTVLYNNSAKMGSYDVITLSGNNISISRKNIDTEEIDYDTFIDNLSVIDNISYKVIYNNEEVTSGDIPRNSILNIYYNNELIDKYYINRDYIFDIDDDISVLEEESIIYDINVGFTKNNLLDKVNTNGETYMLDKNMKPIEDNNIIKTGYIFRTIFENDLDNPLDYKLSVRGDVLGTGELSRENAKEIAKHIIKKNAIKEKEYLLAADYDNDGNIKMNDVIKMLRDKRNKENS